MRKLSILIVLVALVGLVAGCGISLDKRQYDTPNKVLAKAQMSLKGAYKGIRELDERRLVPVEVTGAMLEKADEADTYLKDAAMALRLGQMGQGQTLMGKADEILTALAIKLMEYEARKEGAK